MFPQGVTSPGISQFYPYGGYYGNPYGYNTPGNYGVGNYAGERYAGSLYGRYNPASQNPFIYTGVIGAGYTAMNDLYKMNIPGFVGSANTLIHGIQGMGFRLPGSINTLGNQFGMATSGYTMFSDLARGNMLGAIPAGVSTANFAVRLYPSAFSAGATSAIKMAANGFATVFAGYGTVTSMMHGDYLGAALNAGSGIGPAAALFHAHLGIAGMSAAAAAAGVAGGLAIGVPAMYHGNVTGALLGGAAFGAGMAAFIPGAVQGLAWPMGVGIGTAGALAGAGIFAGMAIGIDGLKKPLTLGSGAETIGGFAAAGAGIGALIGGPVGAGIGAVGGAIFGGVADLVNGLIGIFSGGGRGEEREQTFHGIAGNLKKLIPIIEEGQRQGDPSANQMAYDILSKLQVIDPKDKNPNITLADYPQFNLDSKGNLINTNLLDESRMHGTIKNLSIDANGKAKYTVVNKFDAKNEATTDDLHALNNDINQFLKTKKWSVLSQMPSGAYTDYSVEQAQASAYYSTYNPAYYPGL